MVSKFKFVCYGHIKKKIPLYVPQFNSDGPWKSAASHFQIAKFLDLLIFKLWIRILFWLSYGIRPSIYVLKGWYDETPKKKP